MLSFFAIALTGMTPVQIGQGKILLVKFLVITVGIVWLFLLMETLWQLVLLLMTEMELIRDISVFMIIQQLPRIVLYLEHFNIYSNPATGVYFVEVITNQGKATKKVIKK